MKLVRNRKKFAWVGFEETVNSVTDATLPTDLLIEEPNNHKLMPRKSANKYLSKKKVNNQTQLWRPK